MDNLLANKPLEALLFEQLTDANNAASEHIRIGRSFMARDVLIIIGTASIHKPLDAVIAELIALCRENQ